MEEDINLPEAQNISERFCNNPKSCDITISEIRSALAILANFYEDYKCYIEYEDENSRKSEKCL